MQTDAQLKFQADIRRGSSPGHGIDYNVSGLGVKIEDMGYHFSGDASWMISAEKLMATGKIPDIVRTYSDIDAFKPIRIGQPLSKDRVCDNQIVAVESGDLFRGFFQIIGFTEIGISDNFSNR